jgi:UDP-N-acetylglucosamine 2-epimerase (non-hydrolysing)
MATVLVIVGTRPEVIKMAPVIERLKRNGQARTIVCATGQHEALADQALDIFAIRPDLDLRVMEPDQSLSTLTSKLFDRLGTVARDVRPDWIVAQGDTTTVMVAAMTAFYARTRFGHVEAGLRTGNKDQPFPEEINRVIADRVSDLLFAPTERARRNLLSEGVSDGAIRVTGNTIVDALHAIAARPYDWSAGPLAAVPRGRRLLLVTAHRRESFGHHLQGQVEAIRALAGKYESDLHVVWPVHPNPNVAGPVRAAFAGVTNVSLLEPLDYVSQVQIMRAASVIVTDSGGVQEEAPTFGVPVLVTRDATERPEGIEAGTARLIGAGGDRIVAEVSAILERQGAARTTAPVNPYGDGRAAGRIVDALLAAS